MKFIIILLTFSFFISACSTSGGIYQENDLKNGEFSLEKTIITTIGVLGAAILLGNKSDTNYDYDPYQSDFFSDTPSYQSGNVGVAVPINDKEENGIAVKRQQLLSELERTNKSDTVTVERLRQKLNDLDQ